MDEQKDIQEVVQDSKEVQNKKNPLGILFVFLAVVAAGIGTFLVINNSGKDKKEKEVTKEVEKKKEASPYKIVGNDLQDFDLYFLQLENSAKNKTFSPLSVKYALSMLADGTNGDTKTQIENIRGDYTSKKYVNSHNMSFANGLFIKDTYKNKIKNDYVNDLKTKYDAEVITDSFKTPDTLNNWVSKKTLNLIKNMASDINDKDYVLVNALAIDMEWNNKIQSVDKSYEVKFAHRDFDTMTLPLTASGYGQLKFNNNKTVAKTVSVNSVVNRYDIIKEVGEDNIKKTVTKEYNKWLKKGAPDSCEGSASKEPATNKYVAQYMKEISEGYGHISSSTDFSFYVDEKVKVFAKDLKTYNGTTLQYVGIMPIKEDLTTYIKNAKAKDISTLIDNLRELKIENYKEGVITHVYGEIPMFKFDYKLNLTNDLKKLGITNIFDKDKADLSNLTSEKAYIGEVSHKTTIEFSNDGIKAAAATTEGGIGAAGCGFDYIYKVPVENIDITFNKPYLFFVRDKDTGEVWFTGTVYEPIKG